MTKQTKKANGAAPFDLAALMQGLAIPGLDLETVTDIQRRNWEALLDANRAAAEGYQNLINRQVEIIQSTVQDVSETFQKAVQDGGKGNAPSDQVETAQAGLEQAMGNLRELAEIAQEANTAPIRIVQDRISESVDEWRKLAKR